MSFAGCLKCTKTCPIPVFGKRNPPKIDSTSSIPEGKHRILAPNLVFGGLGEVAFRASWTFLAHSWVLLGRVGVAGWHHRDLRESEPTWVDAGWASFLLGKVHAYFPRVFGRYWGSSVCFCRFEGRNTPGKRQITGWIGRIPVAWPWFRFCSGASSKNLDSVGGYPCYFGFGLCTDF